MEWNRRLKSSLPYYHQKKIIIDAVLMIVYLYGTALAARKIEESIFLVQRQEVKEGAGLFLFFVLFK